MIFSNQKLTRKFMKIKNYISILFNKNLNNQIRNSSSYESKNLLELKNRGIVTSIFPDRPEDYNKLISNNQPQSCYCGFDPTASSLHIGNLLALIGLIHCQRRGYDPIVIIGSATALIGDPSGKKGDRSIPRTEEIVHNSNLIQKNVSKIFQNHEQFIYKRNHKNELPKPKILNNIKWYEDTNIIKFMSSYGKHLRMGNLLSRKQIETRIASKEGINYTEFSYQVFQAYDWLHLLRNYNCTIQIGGNDQTGNMKTGYELISKVLPDKMVFGITLPLITTEKGDKLGKSAGNAVFIDGDKFTPFELYQFFFNTADQIVDTYLKLFTFLPLNEIQDVMKAHKTSPEKFTAQKKLASEITLLVHGNEGLESALKCTKAFFLSDRESLAVMSEKEIEATFKGNNLVTLTMEPGMTVLECALKAKCFRSPEDAVHIIKGGGFRINHMLISNPEEALIFGQHILMNNTTVIRVGKKNYYLIKWLP